MATVAADRLAQQHQRDIATVAGGVTSVVIQAALGADPAAIGTWFWGAVDGLITRVQVGYSQTRNSAMAYLPRHAALSGAGALQLAPGSLDVGALRTSLHVTGPVAFKQAIKGGADTDEALRSMASQMSGAAERYVRDGDRDVIEQTALRGGGIVGWRRRLSGRACGFCAMLASRGAVYVNKQRATVSSRGTRYHDHCRCWPEPMYSREEEPASVQLLQRQWTRVTAGHSGRDAMRVWRRHWEQRVTPQARQRFGLAARMPSGGRAVPGSPVQVRQVLADAQSPEAVSRVLAAEYQRITGRTMVVDLRGSVATAREHAEGVLRAVERQPDLRIAAVRTGPMQSRRAYAEMDPSSRTLIFSDDWSSVPRRDDYLSALAADERSGWSPKGAGNPAGVAVHETGHILDSRTSALDREIDALLFRAQTETGVPIDRAIRSGVSGYAAKNHRELIAEAWSDVVANGARASGLSRAIVRAVEAQPARGTGGMVIAGERFARAQDLSRLPVTRLTAMVRERGITVPTGLRKPALVRLVDDLDSGKSPTLARQQAVLSITDERRAAADALIRAAELGPQSSARALQHVGRVLRRDLPPELQKPFAPLLDALDAADLVRVQAAIPAVARSAKVRQIGGSAGEVKPFKRGEMEWIGDQRGDAVFVIRPGYAATVDGGSVTLRRAAVAPATPEQVAALPAKKAAAKKAPAKKATAAAPDLTGSRGLSTVPEIREVQIENRIRQAVDQLRADPFGRIPQWSNIDLRAGGDWVSVPELRMVLAGIDEAELDAALRRMVRQRGAHVSAESNERQLPALIRGRHVRIGGEDRYWLSLESTTLRPLPTAPAKAAPAKAAKKAAAPAKKATATADRYPLAPGYRGPTAVARQRQREEVLTMTRDQGPRDWQGAQREHADALVSSGYLRRTPSGDYALTDKGRAYFAAAPAKKATAAKKAPAKKAAAPKAPPTPERMTAPALRKELSAAGAPEELLAGVPQPVLARHVTTLRQTGDPLGAGRLRQDIIDRRRALAEALAEAAELLDSQASKTVLSSRAASRLRRVEELVKGWPQEAPLRSLVTAMQAGSPAAIRRAIATAERRGAVKRIGPTSGDVTTYDRKTMSPLGGEKIPDGAQVRVVRPGYEVDIAGERVVLMRPVVEPLTVADILSMVDDPLVTMARIKELARSLGLEMPPTVVRTRRAARQWLSDRLSP